MFKVLCVFAIAVRECTIVGALRSTNIKALSYNDPGVSKTYVKYYEDSDSSRSIDILLSNPAITTIEAHPARKGYDSISFPEGSIWCNGAPTYWITGHQDVNESPWCEVEDGRWERNDAVVLDTEDALNGDIDRHSCAHIDVNRDGIPDLVCSVGANLGAGTGYNELYLTQTDGSLKKVLEGHGLAEFPTMRNRRTVILKNKDGVEEFVFLGTKGRERTDGLENQHRMFRNNYTQENILPYFEEVSGPWTSRMFEATCAKAADFNGDGTDDLVVCSHQGLPLLIQQETNGTFVGIELPSRPFMQAWRNVRIADVTGDGLLDLVVVTWRIPSSVYVFEGQTESPYFDLVTPFFKMDLPYGAPDVEVLDVNLDGVADLYIVQSDEQGNGTYCNLRDQHVNVWWGGRGVQPPAEFTPPLDEARDLLLVGTGRRGYPFQTITMNHTEPGCGWIAHRFDNQTMLLGQGTWGKPGHSLLLKW